MLQFGFFEDFNGSDTLLIWGDADGISQFQKLLARLSTGTDKRAALHAMAWATTPHRLAIDFELSAHKPGALRLNTSGRGVTVLASYAAEQYSEFADKVAALIAPGLQSGHQYLDGPEMAGVQIVVSKDEYPANFGAPG